jgi:uncharacterized protein YbjQ (UPF0145 family)
MLPHPGGIIHYLRELLCLILRTCCLRFTISNSCQAACCASTIRTTRQPMQKLENYNASKLVVTNMEHIPGKQIRKHYGLVSGSVVRSRNIFADWVAGLKSIIGGELGVYTSLLNKSREEAIARMMQQAEFLGANAVTNVRFSTSSVSANAAEIYVYGTAVSVE